MRVLHAAPHPDDELIGAPAMLMALRDAGHEIVNLACSFGGAGEEATRREELEEACRRAGFEALAVAQPLADVPGEPGPNRSEAERRLTSDLRELLGERPVDLVVGPSPHDRHPGHEIVARALLAALEAGSGPDRVWLWGLWAALPFPTIVVEYDEGRLEEIQHALEAHASQVSRNDYRRLLAGRGLAGTVLGPELTFGFASEGLAGPYAEVVTEVVRERGSWRLGAPRRLDPDDPFPEPTGTEIGWWLHAPSAADGLGRAARADPR